MPYITQDRRDALDESDNMQEPRTAGELNYAITKIIVGYLRRQGKAYQNFNDVIGALEGAKLELYRRQIAPYENSKCDENGDVY